MCTMQNHIIQVFANTGNVIKPIGVLNELKSKYSQEHFFVFYIFPYWLNLYLLNSRHLYLNVISFINIYLYKNRCFSSQTGIAKHFRYGSQEDAHEFLRYTVDAMQKSCLPGTKWVSSISKSGGDQLFVLVIVDIANIAVWLNILQRLLKKINFT